MPTPWLHRKCRGRPWCARRGGPDVLVAEFNRRGTTFVKDTSIAAGGVRRWNAQSALQIVNRHRKALQEQQQLAASVRGRAARAYA